jgi:predicted anti-sigma-YlaC factor YlaD
MYHRLNKSRHFKIVRLGILLFALAGCNCSIKKIAVNSIANSLSDGSSSVFASDDDPELVKDALPFALKTMEALLQSTPENENLLLATASGFVQYAHAFVVMPANELEYTDFNAVKREKERAKKLFLRAQYYALKILDLRYEGFSDQLAQHPQKAVQVTHDKDIPALYWTGVAWASALSVAKDDMALVGDLPIIAALMQRAFELDESWGDGALHEFFIAFGAVDGYSIEQHFDRALELNQGQSIGPLVSFADYCVKQQDRPRFEQLLNQALAFDVNVYPDKRLANVLSQRRAAFLLDNKDHLFLDVE